MKSKIYAFVVLIIAFIAYFGAIRRAGSWLVKEDELTHADAIVLLMGSIPDRVLQSSDLYRNKVAGRVIIVEESMGDSWALKSKGINIISNTSQVVNILAALEIPVDSITVLPGNATSTQMEAMVIRDYVSNQPCIDTLLIVSSAYHTRRASMIFRSAFKETKNHVTILCSPSAYTNFDAAYWWRSKENIQKVLMEYLKMVNFLFFEKRQL